jgi:MFS family permease
VSTAVAAALLDAPSGALVAALLVAGGLSMSWNALAFTAAAEFGGWARSGVSLGFQQTALSISSAVAPLVFAPLVDHTSWRVGFVLIALCPLAALYTLRGLGR